MMVRKHTTHFRGCDCWEDGNRYFPYIREMVDTIENALVYLNTSKPNEDNEEIRAEANLRQSLARLFEKGYFNVSPH